MPTYRVEVEHTTTTREVLDVTANDVADAEARAHIYEHNGRKSRADIAVHAPRETDKRRAAEFRVVAVRERGA